MRHRVPLLIVLAGAFAVMAMIAFGGLIGARGIPRETLGRTPEEWRALLNELLDFGAFLAYLATWIGGALILRNVNHAARKVRCLACGYAKAGLPAGAPCPECGGTASTLAPMFDQQRRFIESLSVWMIGAAILFFTLIIIYPSGPRLALFHAAMSAPAIAVVGFDRRLTVGQSTFITMVVTTGAILGTAWGMYGSTHSTDGQAALGIIGAFFAGWMFAGPSFLLAAIAVRIAANRADRD